jgi:hypothetical protein
MLDKCEKSCEGVISGGILVITNLKIEKYTPGC